MEIEYHPSELQEMTLNGLLEQTAHKLKTDNFISYGETGRKVSYKELDEIANSIGNSLRAWGVSEGQRVSVMLRDPLRTIFTMYGIPKCGGIYAPISFEYKGSTLSYQLNDTRPEYLIIEDQYIDRINAIVDDIKEKPNLIIYEKNGDYSEPHRGFTWSTFEELLERKETPPDASISWEDEAWLLYTSGTTGDPKGVSLPHRWIVANHATFRSSIFTREDTVHCSLPLNHAGGASALINAALRGGASVSLWNRFSASQFWDRINRYDVTFAPLYGVMISWLRNQTDSQLDRSNTLNKVMTIPLPEDYKEIADRFGFEFLFVLFGQTEIGHPIRGLIHAAKNENATPDDIRLGRTPEEIITKASEREVPVVDEVPDEGYMGKPRSSLFDIRILDGKDRAVAPGEVGELAVRPKIPSVILQGYYNKPEETVEAFKNLWFHTGDAAYRDGDENYYFVGRLGDVIRKHGENISAQQLEDIASSFDSIIDVAVFPISAEEGGEDEIGMAISTDESYDEKEYRQYLENNMAGYMIPDYIWIVDEMPTTRTDKIQKNKLKEMLHST